MHDEKRWNGMNERWKRLKGLKWGIVRWKRRNEDESIRKQSTQHWTSGPVTHICATLAKTIFFDFTDHCKISKNNESHISAGQNWSFWSVSSSWFLSSVPLLLPALLFDLPWCKLLLSQLCPFIDTKPVGVYDLYTILTTFNSLHTYLVSQAI